MGFQSLIAWRRTPATRDDFFDPFVSFQHEMDRMFDDLFTNFGAEAQKAMRRIAVKAA